MSDQETHRASVSAILAIVLTVLGTIGGSLVTGAFTYNAAQVQASVASEQSRLQLLRMQRQAAYAGFLTAADNLRIRENDLSSRIKRGTGLASNVEVEPAIIEINDLYRKLIAAGSQVRLLGSSSMFAAASELELREREMQDVINADGDYGPPRARQIDDKIREIAESYGKVVAVGRNDLGNSD